MTLVLASLLALPVQFAQGVDATQVRSVPIGFIVVPLMVAVFVLWRSLNKQLKRIDFDQTAESDSARMSRQQRSADKADH